MRSWTREVSSGPAGIIFVSCAVPETVVASVVYVIIYVYTVHRLLRFLRTKSTPCTVSCFLHETPINGAFPFAPLGVQLGGQRKYYLEKDKFTRICQDEIEETRFYLDERVRKDRSASVFKQ